MIDSLFNVTVGLCVAFYAFAFLFLLIATYKAMKTSARYMLVSVVHYLNAHFLYKRAILRISVVMHSMLFVIAALPLFLFVDLLEFRYFITIADGNYMLFGYDGGKYVQYLPLLGMACIPIVKYAMLAVGWSIGLQNGPIMVRKKSFSMF